MVLSFCSSAWILIAQHEQMDISSCCLLVGQNFTRERGSPQCSACKILSPKQWEMLRNKDHKHWLEKLSPNQMQSESSDGNAELFSSRFQTFERIKTAERFTGHCRVSSGFMVFYKHLFLFCGILLAQRTNCSRKSKMWNALAFNKGQHANLVKITGLILFLALFHLLALL